MDDFYERPIFLAADAQSSTFYIAPCSKKDKIADLIEAYYGSVTEDPTGPYTVRLCDPDNLVGPVDGTEEWFDIKYVEDSITNGEQQPLNWYRINDTLVDFEFRQVLWRKCTWQEARRQIESKMESEPEGTPAKKKHFRPYSEKERIQMISYIQRTCSMDRLNGNSLWKEMEKDKVLDNRSWQSMKEHFRKYIAPEIKKGMSSKYSKILSEVVKTQHSPTRHSDNNERHNLIVKHATRQLPSSPAGSKDVMEGDSAVEPSVDEAEPDQSEPDELDTEYSNGNSSSELEEPEFSSDDAELHSSGTRKRSNKQQKKAAHRKIGFRDPYHQTEDRAIIQYIINNKCFNLVKGRQMWQEMEAEFGTGRTWQSLKSRYLKHIAFHLNRYKVTQEHYSLIKKGAQTSQSRARKNIKLPKRKRIRCSLSVDTTDEEMEQEKHTTGEKVNALQQRMRKLFVPPQSTDDENQQS